MAVTSVSLSLHSDAGNGCLVDVFSSDGRCEVVTVTITTYPASTLPQYHCFDNSNCCEKAAVVPVSSRPYSTIAPYETDVSFRNNPCPGYDGGAASMDGGAIDRAID